MIPYHAPGCGQDPAETISKTDKIPPKSWGLSSGSGVLKEGKIIKPERERGSTRGRDALSF